MDIFYSHYLPIYVPVVFMWLSLCSVCAVWKAAASCREHVNCTLLRHQFLPPIFLFLVINDQMFLKPLVPKQKPSNNTHKEKNRKSPDKLRENDEYEKKRERKFQPHGWDLWSQPELDPANNLVICQICRSTKNKEEIKTCLARRDEEMSEINNASLDASGRRTRPISRLRKNKKPAAL